jgi:hypothetical protein
LTFIIFLKFAQIVIGADYEFLFQDDNAFEIKVPRPGGTVYVRTKQCDGKTDSHGGEHQHVRHYVVFYLYYKTGNL